MSLDAHAPGLNHYPMIPLQHNAPLRLLPVVLVAMVLSGCATAMEPCPAGFRDTDSERIYVVRHRWHTGIILPAERIAEEMAFLAGHFEGQPQWYKFGWGDDRFYPDPRVRPLLILRALFWPTDSLVHVVAKQRHPGRYPATNLVSVPMSVEEQRRLARAIGAQFDMAQSGNGDIDPVEEGLYLDSAFFPARGTFWAGRTCNSWVSGMLEGAGTGDGPFNALTAGSTLRRLGDVEGACRVPRG